MRNISIKLGEKARRKGLRIDEQGFTYLENTFARKPDEVIKITNRIIVSSTHITTPYKIIKNTFTKAKLKICHSFNTELAQVSKC